MSANQSRYDPLQTIRIGRPAPPTVQDPTPWQLALQGKAQDTGGGESAQGPWSDNTPVQGGQASGQAGGAFGYSYADPGGGWNPWSLYDSRQGYDGTAVDGYYNAAADTVRHDSGRGDGSTMNSRDTVWRWTLDDLGKQYGGNPGSAPPEAVKAAFLNNVARLKRDWNAPENAGRGDWANSGFAGYDRFARGGPGQGIGGAAQAAAQAGSGAVQRAAGQQGGTGMADPGAAARAAAQAAGQAAAQAAANSGYGQPGNQVGQSATNTFTGQTNGTGSAGTFGQMAGVDPTLAFGLASADPGVAAHYLRLAQGQKGPVTSTIGHFKDNLYGKALQAFLALNGVGGGGQSGPQDMQAFLAAMQGGGLQALLGGAAARAGGADFTGQEDVDVEKVLRAALALRSVNMGSLGSTLAGNNLDNLLYDQQGLNLGDNGGDSGVGGGLARGLHGGGYGQALRSYLGVK